MRRTRRYFRRKKRKTRRRRKRRKRTRRRRQRRGRGTPQTPSRRKRPESTPSRRPPSVYYDTLTGLQNSENTPRRQRPRAGRFKPVRPLAGRFKPVRPLAEPIPPSTKVVFCEKCNQPTSIPVSNRFFVCKECGHRQNTPLTASEVIKRYPFDNSTQSKTLPGQRFPGNEIHMHLLAPGKKTKGEKRAKVKAAVKRTGAKTKGVFKAFGQFLRTKPKKHKQRRVRLSEVHQMPEVGTQNDEGGVFLG